MPETRTYTVYKFHELSEDIQKKAIEKLCDINVNHDWWDFVYDDAENIGLKITSFDTSYREEITGDFILNADDCARKILKEHGKLEAQEEETGTRKIASEFLEELSCLREKLSGLEKEHDEVEHTDHDLADSLYDKIKDTEEEIETLEKEFKNDLLREYLSILRKELDYLLSEEAIIETIEANDYDFREDGSID